MPLNKETKTNQTKPEQEGAIDAFETVLKAFGKGARRFGNRKCILKENIVFIGMYVNTMEYWIVKKDINTNQNK